MAQARYNSVRLTFLLAPAIELPVVPVGPGPRVCGRMCSAWWQADLLSSWKLGSIRHEEQHFFFFLF